jgi:hypothetical protein
MAGITSRIGTVLALVTLTWLFAPLALAQEEGPATPVAGTETTVAEAPATTSGLEPAVPIENEDEAAATPDWTYRYLIPTALALTVLIVLFTSIRYFSDVVRKRYRVVEE